MNSYFLFHPSLSLSSYMAMHTFGQKMIYPGSTSLMNFLLCEYQLLNLDNWITERPKEHEL